MPVEANLLLIPLEDDPSLAFHVPKSKIDDIIDGASDIVQACLDLPWFKPENPEARASLNDEAFRDGFYENVVRPLHDLNERLWSENTVPAGPSSAGINTY